MAIIYRVTSPAWLDEEPGEYGEDSLIHWYDEVFEEGYKKPKDAKFPSLDEVLTGLELSGYTVVRKE